MSCRQRAAFLDGRLGEADRRGFELHLRGCAECQLEVEHWQATERQLEGWADRRRLPSPTPAEAAALVARSRSAAAGSTTRLRWALGTAGAMAVLLLALLFWGRSPDQTPQRGVDAPRVLLAEGMAEPDLDRLRRAGVSVPADARLLLDVGQDRVALTDRGQLGLEAQHRSLTRLRLHHGTLAVDATPGAPRRFLVIAGHYRVLVAGTRFQLRLQQPQQLEVAVVRGAVQVSSRRARATRVPAGSLVSFDQGRPDARGVLPAVRAQQITAALDPRPQPVAMAPDQGPADPGGTADGGAAADGGTQPADGTTIVPVRHRPPAPANRSPRGTSGRPGGSEQPPVQLERVTEWVLAGEHARAERALLRRLTRTPRDARAWELLATCRRKSGRNAAAVEAYRKLIAIDRGPRAARARFYAAVLLLEKLARPAAAESLLQQYLGARPALLEAEALLHLGRAQLAQQQWRRAKATLQRLVEKHRGTASALRGQRLLDAL